MNQNPAHPVDDSEPLIRALAAMAAFCGQALEAASVGAADPQWRALLLHRGSLQQRAANDLVMRMPPPPNGEPRVALPPAAAATRERPGDTPVQVAHRRALRSLSACAAILRGDLADPLQRSLLIRYYHETAELVRVLEQRTREHVHGTRRANLRSMVGGSPHR